MGGPTLRDKLRNSSSDAFVGRADIRAWFKDACNASTPESVLFVYGPGGVGKTTLVRKLVSIASASNRPAFLLDGRSFSGTPDSFTDELRRAMGCDDDKDLVDALDELPAGPVLLIDTFEEVSDLEPWLVREFLMSLPGSSIVVLLGRRKPGKVWTTEPGWDQLLRVEALRNFSRADSVEYLTSMSMPEELHQSVIRFSHGHPLALSLFAEIHRQRPSADIEPVEDQSLIKTLLDRFVQKVPSQAHRAAIESCSVVRSLTEDVLAAMLDTPDAHDLFEWLRERSFIESGPDGLFPHDLTRKVLREDLKWRNAAFYRQLHNRARSYYTTQLHASGPDEQEAILFNYIYLHRDNPVVQPFFGNLGAGAPAKAVRHPLSPADVDTLAGIVAAKEGAESAATFREWAKRQPDQFVQYKDANGGTSGFLMTLRVDGPSKASDKTLKESTDAAPASKTSTNPAAIVPSTSSKGANRNGPMSVDDIAVSQVVSFLNDQAPLAAGERATLFRYWMDADSYQDLSRTQTQLFVEMVRHYLVTPNLMYSFLPISNADFWGPILQYADLHLIDGLSFKVGEQTHGTYAHDWRATPPDAWLDLLGNREIGAVAKPPQHKAPSITALSKEDFSEALDEALKFYAQPWKLTDNQLLLTAVVDSKAEKDAGVEERIAAMQSVIAQYTDELSASPKLDKGRRAIERTYLKPAGTQELAAEALDLPFSTYRRHLKKGMSALLESLWLAEIGQ